jgi:hypothetical protein
MDGSRRSQTMGMVFAVFALIAVLVLYMMPPSMVAVNASDEGFVDTVRCGVSMPSCDAPLRCVNGYCKSDNPPTMPAVSDLPIRPDRYPFAPNYDTPSLPLPPALTA